MSHPLITPKSNRRLLAIITLSLNAAVSLLFCILLYCQETLPHHKESFLHHRESSEMSGFFFAVFNSLNPALAITSLGAIFLCITRSRLTVILSATIALLAFFDMAAACAVLNLYPVASWKVLFDIFFLIALFLCLFLPAKSTNPAQSLLTPSDPANSSRSTTGEMENLMQPFNRIAKTLRTTARVLRFVAIVMLGLDFVFLIFQVITVTGLPATIHLGLGEDWLLVAYAFFPAVVVCIFLLILLACSYMITALAGILHCQAAKQL